MSDMKTMPNKSRARVKSAEVKYGNDQIFKMRNFDESSRWTGWSKNEFSHRLSLQAGGGVRSACPDNCRGSASRLTSDIRHG